MKALVSFIILFSVSVSIIASEEESSEAKAYDCNLVRKNGRTNFEKTIFSTKGISEAKTAYLNSLIIKNGDIFEAKQSGGDDFELGIVNSAPSLASVVAVDCVATSVVIDLSLTGKE